MLLKVCVNGVRGKGDHPALPVTPTELAAQARAAVEAGAGAVHLHPKDENGSDTVAAHDVAAAVRAVRAVAPGVPVGVTSGAWAAGGAAERLAAVRAWTVLPDFTSVNWHEPGAVELASTLLSMGVGVEAGLWTPEAVRAWAAWPERGRCLRVLLEVVDDLPATEAVAAAGRLVAALPRPLDVPVLLHGEGTSAWPVFDEAVRLGLDTRIGLEDVLVLPDGAPARDNADLVTVALRRSALT